VIAKETRVRAMARLHMAIVLRKENHVYLSVCSVILRLLINCQMYEIRKEEGSAA
jgi:hypothetical protein